MRQISLPYFAAFKLTMLGLASATLVLTSGCAGRGGKAKDTAYARSRCRSAVSCRQAVELDTGDPMAVAAALFDEVERQQPIRHGPAAPS